MSPIVYISFLAIIIVFCFEKRSEKVETLNIFFTFFWKRKKCGVLIKAFFLFGKKWPLKKIVVLRRLALYAEFSNYSLKSRV